MVARIHHRVVIRVYVVVWVIIASVLFGVIIVLMK